MVVRILLYTHEYPPVKAGAGNYVFELAKGLSALGEDVAVVAPGYDGHGSGDANDRITVHRMRTWETAPPWCYRFFLAAFLKERPHMVVVADRNAQEIVARMPRRFFSYCTVLYGTEVWTYFDPQRSPFRPAESKLFERFFLGAEAILAISDATARLLDSYLPQARPLISVVGAGIDPACFPAPSRERLEKLRAALTIGSQNIVLCLARLDGDKGHDALVGAFRRVLEEAPDTVLLLVGDGPTRMDVEEIAKSSGVFEQVRFVGSVSDEERCDYYGLCDLFVMPSRCERRWEGFGLVFLEANCYGKPVIGGAVGGVPEAIEDGVSGLLVNPLDETAIADAMLRLLKDRTLREKLGAQGRRRLLAGYTSDEVALKTLTVIRDRLCPDRSFRGVACKVRRGANLGYWLVYAGFIVLLERLRWLRFTFLFRIAQSVLPARCRRLLRALFELPLHGRHRHEDLR